MTDRKPTLRIAHKTAMIGVEKQRTGTRKNEGSDHHPKRRRQAAGTISAGGRDAERQGQGKGCAQAGLIVTQVASDQPPGNAQENTRHPECRDRYRVRILHPLANQNLR